MNIKNTSVYGTNIIFLLNEHINYPENNAFLTLFSGDKSKGMNFSDNSNVSLKVLEVPAMGISVVLEGRRLRIEDRLLKSPEESDLPEVARQIFTKLFVGQESSLLGYGFNFDIIYQLKEVVRINDIFSQINPNSLDNGDSLLNLGWQWTLSRKDGKGFDGYFLKITAPLEIAVHHNSHYNEKILPTKDELNKGFVKSFSEIHQHISGFMI